MPITLFITTSPDICQISGVATLEQIVTASMEAFNMDRDLAAALSAFGIVGFAFFSFLLLTLLTLKRLRFDSLPGGTPI